MDFSCTVMPGEAMGIVGESGCGKSTVSLGIMRDLSNIGKIVGGRIKFQGKDMGEMSEEELRADPRQQDRHDLPGADGEPEPGDEGRPAADGSADHPRQGVEGGGLQARAGDGARGAAARSRADDALLSAPAFGRPAAAHRHRHGAAVEAGAAAARRADDGARRDGRGRHRRTGEGARQGIRHVDDLRVAQSRPDPRDLRPHHRDVFRRGGGDRQDQGRVRPHAPPLYAGAVPLDPAARRRQEFAAADRHSRPAAAAARAAEGLQFRAALPPFRRGRLQRRRNPDDRGRRATRAISAAACASTRSTGTALPRGRHGEEGAGRCPARRCCKIEDLRKYYKVVGQRDLRRRAKAAYVKANETISFTARESETVAIVGESGCGKSTLAKVLLGLETASRPAR